jgi:uncharacterized membrane protein YeaQ/YmgE (transglycosylase-associated protein family)
MSYARLMRKARYSLFLSILFGIGAAYGFFGMTNWIGGTTQVTTGFLILVIFGALTLIFAIRYMRFKDEASETIEAKFRSRIKSLPYRGQ